MGNSYTTFTVYMRIYTNTAYLHYIILYYTVYQHPERCNTEQAGEHH